MILFGANGKPLAQTMETVKGWRRMRMNPLRSLTAETLARALDNFEYGNLREAALLFDVIAERDDTLKSVKPKREKGVSGLDWQIMPGKGVSAKDAGFQAQKDVLERFWSNVRAVNAYNRNERGGFGRLVRQMMSAASMRYAAHHIVWRPSAGRLEATFEFVPLWLFENTTGTLRYLRNPFAMEGETLDGDEWMVTVGDGLMVACSIGYWAKRAAYNDWLIFSEKFSMPGVLGRTSAKKGSEEGNMMKQAVQTFGHDWSGVLYGDDGTHKEPLQLIQAQGNPSAMPQPALLERVDRKFAALYRGADLSTMSSRDGEGTGASLQGDEAGILLRDDADTVEETVEPVSRRVLEWHYGRGVEVLARLRMIVPTDENEEFVLRASTELADRGVPVSEASTAEKLGIQLADEDEKVLAGKGAGVKDGGAGGGAWKAEEVPNAVDVVDAVVNLGDGNEAGLSVRELLDGARRADLEGLGEELARLLKVDGVDDFLAGVRELGGRLPEYVSATAASEGVWEAANVSALGEGFAAGGGVPEGGEAEEEANSGTRSGAIKGWITRRMRGWSREGRRKNRSRDQFGKRLKGRPLSADENEERLGNAVNYALKERKGVRGAAHHAELGVIDLPWGTPGDKSSDFRGGKGLSHILAKHGEKDVRLLPRVLSRGTVESHGDPVKRHVRLRDPRFKPEDPEGILVEAVLVKTKSSKSWVLTNYTKKNS